MQSRKFYLILVLLLLSSIHSPDHSDNSSTISTEGGFPFFSTSGTVHLVLEHECIDYDAVGSDLYHLMKVGDSWSRANLICEELVDDLFTRSMMHSVRSVNGGVALYFVHDSIQVVRGIYNQIYNEDKQIWG